MRYAVGDVHGCVKTLKKMVEEIIRLHCEDVLYLVGDYIDKGPDSRAVIDYLCALQEKGFSVYPLRGNREQEFLDIVRGKGDFWDWYSKGGDVTMKSFGLEGKSPEELKKIPYKYLKFIISAPHYVELEDYILVHAGFRWDKGSVNMSRETVLYSRQNKTKKNMLGKKIIHGHQPYTLHQIRKKMKNPELSVLSIDAGCVYKKKGMGYLAAINMDTFELYAQKNIDF